jgi:hypothetical protein
MAVAFDPDDLYKTNSLPNFRTFFPTTVNRLVTSCQDLALASKDDEEDAPDEAQIADEAANFLGKLKNLIGSLREKINSLVAAVIGTTRNVVVVGDDIRYLTLNVASIGLDTFMDRIRYALDDGERPREHYNPFVIVRVVVVKVVNFGRAFLQYIYDFPDYFKTRIITVPEPVIYDI